jgi:hypothetical protein
VVVRLALGMLVVATGCDAIFSPSPYDVPSYSLEMSTAYIGNTLDTRPTGIAPGDAVYLVEDAGSPDGFARTPAEVIGAGLWYAVLGADGASVMYRVPDLDYVRIVQLPVRDLVGRATVLRRADAAPGVDTSTIAISATFGEQYNVGRLQTYIVGAWVAHDHTGLELPPTGSTEFTVPGIAYAGFFPVGQTQRWRFTSADQPVILRYNTAERLIGALQVEGFDQGTNDTFTGTISVVPLDRTITFDTDPTAVERHTLVQPAVSSPSYAWGIYAAPGLPVGILAGPQLAYGPIAPTDPVRVSVTYGNPFDWPDTLHVVWNAYRVVTLDNPSGSIGLYAGAVAITPAIDDAPATLDVPTPIEVRVGSASLATDNVVVPIDRTQPVEISATFDREADGVFIAALYTLEHGPGGYTRHLRAEMFARRPTWRVPAEIFDVNGPYFIRVIQYASGFPGIDAGEVLVAPPVVAAYLDSGAFTVP